MFYSVVEKIGERILKIRKGEIKPLYSGMRDFIFQFSSVQFSRSVVSDSL